MSMKLPLWGLASAIITALGGYGLYWYHNLSKSEREKADRLAADYAKWLFNKALNELTSHQLKRVYELVKGHFAA